MQLLILCIYGKSQQLIAGFLNSYLMIMKILILKLRLYKFLGNFIPYFKRMMLDRDSMLRYINKFVSTHANTYANIGLFTIDEGIIVESDITTIYFKIEYVITYEKSVFKTFITYFENNVTLSFKSSDINSSDDLFEISDFVKHFNLINQQSLLTVFNHFK